MKDRARGSGAHSSYVVPWRSYAGLTWRTLGKWTSFKFKRGLPVEQDLRGDTVLGIFGEKTQFWLLSPWYCYVFFIFPLGLVLHVARLKLRQKLR
jgi:hypothetical protein